ncbi:MAG: hypothetical protein WC682_03570 [Parcubacteria group bacterium]|jgi:hypothetical protein
MSDLGKEKGEDFRVEDIYTPLEVAKEEIWRRWNDKELKKKVKKFLDKGIPEIMLNSPKAILARHVASPNNEFIKYLKLSKKIDLKPICLEYLSDKFRSENQDKYYLGKMFFCDGLGKKNGKRLSAKKVVDLDYSEGKRLSDMKTLWGDNFIKFHHNLFCNISEGFEKSIVDESLWIKKNGGDPKLFYEKFFSLFICYGVLFENYLENKNEKDFTDNLVIPNFKKVYNIFGIKPLVVKIYPSKRENDLFWRYYPKSIEKIK